MRDQSAVSGIREPDHIRSAAERIYKAATSGQPCDPIRDLIDITSIDDAYAAQNLNTERSIAAGRRVVGCKIGLTSLAVQRQLGVDQPDFGVLFDDMAVGEGIPIPFHKIIAPRIEAEIAIVLGSDIDLERPTIADVLRVTAYAVPAFEIVGSRIRNWDIKIVDTIADNASSGMFVLGGPARKLDGLDLRGAAMSMSQNGIEVSTGSGAACLGSPLNAACWLIGEMSRRGRPLRAGDLVLTGALGPMISVNPGDEFDATIEGLGTVHAVFTKDEQ